ncbi:hypothetical protein [Caballeronia sp. BR00000012568055]|uniref:hypothetical protein n=1 Tax=Caballeronia sp. BR00000012568055 TaxID=2918761 RepID=UPI0023F87D23|nr:hypothetical protein [Caballeronia sp. BR00000012568055]
MTEKFAEPVTPHQHDEAVKAALKRFRRSALEPKESEDFRLRLIQGRVLNGLTIKQAQDGFTKTGVHVNIAAIESGALASAKSVEFLLAATTVYSCSADWLVGISPDVEPDARRAAMFAQFRHMETFIGGAVAQFVKAAEDSVRAVQFGPDEIENFVNAIDAVAARYERLCMHASFDTLPAAPLGAAVMRLKAMLPRLRTVHQRYTELDSLFGSLGDSAFLPPALRAAHDAWSEFQGRGNAPSMTEVEIE